MKIYETELQTALKNGAKAKIIDWGYEDGAYVTLVLSAILQSVGVHDCYDLIINRPYPQQPRNLFILTYSAMNADWMIITE